MPTILSPLFRSKPTHVVLIMRMTRKTVALILSVCAVCTIVGVYTVRLHYSEGKSSPKQLPFYNPAELAIQTQERLLRLSVIAVDRPEDGSPCYYISPSQPTGMMSVKRADEWREYKVQLQETNAIGWRLTFVSTSSNAQRGLIVLSNQCWLPFTPVTFETNCENYKMCGTWVPEGTPKY